MDVMVALGFVIVVIFLFLLGVVAALLIPILIIRAAMKLWTWSKR